MKRILTSLAVSQLFFLTSRTINAQYLPPAKDTVFVSNGNPIIRHRYTADPAALVYKDKVYLYTGHDVAPQKENRYVMNEWLCFSTPDMKTWTEILRL